MRVPAGWVLRKCGAERGDTKENSAKWRGHSICGARRTAAGTVGVRLWGRRGCIVCHRNRRIVQFRRWLDYARAGMDATQRPGVAVAARKRTKAFVAEIFAGGLALLWNAAAATVKKKFGAAAKVRAN